MAELRRSRFTYRDLERLGKYSVDTPLRVIAHIDLDAFYAQCETVRLGIDETLPLAVQQWENLIAINYPARALGLTARHVSAIEAQKLVPSLRLVHVATWKSGCTQWSYPEPGMQDIHTSKACLDPYRIESKKILNIFRRNCERVEKASVDESFLDLSRMVGEKVQERYRKILGVAPPYGDPTERLPLPPMKELEWSESTLVEFAAEDEAVGEAVAEGMIDVCGHNHQEKNPGTDKELEAKDKPKEEYTEEDPLDWDDVCLAIAAEIVADIRKQVRVELKYTCSAGISRNKMLAKLASGYKKPNNQTVVRSRAINPFLSGIKFTKIRNLGGKLGNQISETFTTTHIPTLLTISLPTLSTKLPPDTALWLYNTLRGIDRSEVNPRTLIKSMLSAKSFRPPLKTSKDAIGWLRIFVADISGRLREEGCLQPGGRRPKTMSLGWRGGGKTGWGAGGKSKGCTIPASGELSDDVLFGLAEGLLKGVDDWPCGNLSLSMGGFEETEGGRGIMGFLVRGDSIRVKKVADDHERDSKRRKLDAGIKRGRKGFLSLGETEENEVDQLNRQNDEDYWMEEDCEGMNEAGNFDHSNQESDDLKSHQNILLQMDSFNPPHTESQSGSRLKTVLDLKPVSKPRFFTSITHPPQPLPQPSEQSSRASALLYNPSPSPSHPCPKCNSSIPFTELAEHEDWHFAKDLLEEERKAARAATSVVAAPAAAPLTHRQQDRTKRKSSTAVGSGGRGIEKGQRKLTFGKK